MIKILIVEDVPEIYSYYTNIFSKALPEATEYEFVHAPSIETACAVLNEPWDAILLDYDLGEAFEYEGETIKNGAALSLAIKKRRGKSRNPLLIGLTSARATGNLMRVDVHYNKVNVLAAVDNLKALREGRKNSNG